MAATGRRVAADPRSTFAELDASWASCGARPTTEFTCAVGGLTLRIEGHGRLAGRLVPALRHHPVRSGGADLTIRVWDLETAPVRPRLPVELFQADGGHDLGTDHEVRFRYDWPQRVVQAWDAASGVAYWVAEDPDTLAWWEEAAPLRPVLAWWLTSNDRYFAHGAGLAIDGKAVLLVGPGGSGKSTTALRAQRAGTDFLGDDYCLVAPAASGLTANATGYSVATLYRTVKLRPIDGPSFETELASNEHGRKIVLALDADTGGDLLETAELVGVAALEIGRTVTTTVEHGLRGTVLRALAPTTFAQLPGVGARSLSVFGTMLRELPTAVVRLGPDPDEVVASVRELIRMWS